MFNLLISVYNLFILSLISLFVIMLVRFLFIKRTIFLLGYHIFLFIILFIAAIGGGSVQNDGYTSLERFILLEKNNQLEDAKNNPKEYVPQYVPEFEIDLKHFKGSNEFRDYLRRNDIFVDKAEAVSIGWLFAVLVEISMVFAQVLAFIIRGCCKFGDRLTQGRKM